MSEEKWFPRFAEIPGIRHEPPKGLDFSHLRWRGLVPEISYYDFDGQKRKSMMWTYGGTTTSAAPAKGWTTEPRRGESRALTALRQVYETLELPGTLSDYHFALQGARDELRKYITQESWVLSEIEKLCRLNIQLVDKYPETISYERDGELFFYSVTMFHTLIKLYENEGYLREALEVAKIAVRFENVRSNIVEELQERIKLMESEDGDG